MTSLTPTVTGSVSSYSVSPALPAGLTLNATTGAISGTPTSKAAEATYTITATNGGGSTTFELILAVNAQTASGVFVDSIVSGLSYVSGDQTGETDAQGHFTYEVGEDVTFSVGAVTLGSAAGAEFVTPLDLIADGASTTLAVQNIVRFLMLMDSDGDPANGITISEALRARAADWPAVGFTTSDLDAALVDIIPDTSVDGAIRTLPSAATAQTHVEGGVRCLYSGMFKGTYTGEDQGRWALLVSPWGILSGGVYSTVDEEGSGVAFDTPLLPVQRGPITVTGASPGTTFSIQFDSLDSLSGHTAGNEETLTGQRIAGSATSAYKFHTLLLLKGTPAGLVSFDIDDDDQVTAVAGPELFTTETRSVEATLTGDLLNATVNPGPTITGTLNKDTLSLTGTWSDAASGTSGTLLAHGCRLH